ncbi:MAG: PD40 domain-containing protein [Thermotogae bacterium]|nr:PD40 domain-containing protein [Thermotogota bacterium]
MVRRFLSVLVPIIVVILVLTSCGGSIIITIGDYGILFVTERDGNKEIYLAKPNVFGGIDVVNLTNNSADDISPAWRNDGVIAFFRRNSSNGYSLWIMNGDGSGQIKRYDFSDCSMEGFLPSWSPDGTKIVIRYTTSTLVCSLVVYDLSSGTLDTLESGFLIPLGNGLMNPSPSYHEVLYSKGTSFIGGNDIYTSSYDGSVKNNLTNTTSTEEIQPCWNSDGTKIAYVGSTTDGYEVFVMNRDGSSKTQITNDTLNDYHPHWVGNKIVYEKDGDIYLSYFDGTNWNEKAVYVDATTDEKYPRLSPDGKRIAFISNKSGDWRIYVVEIDDQGNPVGAPSEISNGTVDENYPPLWSPMLF